MDWGRFSSPNETGKSVPTSAFEHNEEIAGRLKAVIDSVGGLGRASDIAGVSNDALAKWRDGKARPAFFALATLARAAGKSADWVLLGDQATPEGTRAPAVMADDFTLVPRLGVEASAGHGLVALAEEVTERLAFKTDWLREMGLSPSLVGLVTCRGDSQDPVIKDGALMLVDMRPDQVIRSGCFYVIVLEGDVLVKLINRRTDGTIELISHNAAYPKEIIDSQRLDKLTIPGRVVWAGQKL
ncbi:hypothetical protein C4375_18820 [Devosia sp. I507]|nr:hypothetical protein C4375_18820 [Devosia sp. I507]